MPIGPMPIDLFCRQSEHVDSNSEDCTDSDTSDTSDAIAYESDDDWSDDDGNTLYEIGFCRNFLYHPIPELPVRSTITKQLHLTFSVAEQLLLNYDMSN